MFAFAIGSALRRRAHPELARVLDVNASSHHLEEHFGPRDVNDVRRCILAESYRIIHKIVTIDGLLRRRLVRVLLGIWIRPAELVEAVDDELAITSFVGEAVPGKVVTTGWSGSRASLLGGYALR